MDIHQATELVQLTDEQIKLSREYYTARLISAEANIKLDQLLASKYLREFRAEKPNLGYDMAIVMLMEKESDSMELYRTWQSETAKYKGLEKILDSIQTKISYYQSMMKYQLDGERGAK